MRLTYVPELPQPSHACFEHVQELLLFFDAHVLVRSSYTLR